MKKAHKKRSHEATANSPPGLSDMGELFYKSGKFYYAFTYSFTNSIK